MKTFKIKDWNIEEMCGYKPKTTFYIDFSIADIFGESAIKETYNLCFSQWKDNYEYLTELVMVLNWKSFEHYESNEKYGKLYSNLWEMCDRYACENLKGEELDYFFITTD